MVSKERDMIRRQLLGALFGFAGLISASVAAAEFNCWDGSFGYNAASLVQTQERFELVLQGSMLGPLNFDGFREAIKITEWNRSTIYIPFKIAECSFSDDKKSGKCEKSLPESERIAYVGREVVDLNDFLFVITPIYAKKIAMEFSLGSAISVHFDDQATSVGLEYCGDENAMPGFMQVGFPQ